MIGSLYSSCGGSTWDLLSIQIVYTIRIVYFVDARMKPTSRVS